MAEQRRFSRIPFEAKVTLQKKQQHWDSELVDVSLKGALITQPAEWAGDIGDAFLIDIELNDSGVIIHMEGSVAHVEHGRVGFRCDHIDLDSITHLRRLVELNIGNTELLNRELSLLGY